MFKKREKTGNNKAKIKYRWVIPISKILVPVFTVLFYFFLVLTAVLLIAALILPVINVPIDEMLMPPFMHAVTEGTETVGYDVYVGNGIRMYVEREDVTLSDIKTVYYAAVAALCGVLLTLSPIMKFSALFLRNITSGDSFNEKNPKYIDYIGRVVFIGNTIVLFLERFYNYYLVKLFVSDGSNISLSLGIGYSGMLLGIMIMFFGHIFGYICSLHNQNEKNEIIESEEEAE